MVNTNTSSECAETKNKGRKTNKQTNQKEGVWQAAKTQRDRIWSRRQRVPGTRSKIMEKENRKTATTKITGFAHRGKNSAFSSLLFAFSSFHHSLKQTHSHVSCSQNGHSAAPFSFNVRVLFFFFLLLFFGRLAGFFSPLFSPAPLNIVKKKKKVKRGSTEVFAALLRQPHAHVQ